MAVSDDSDSSPNQKVHIHSGTSEKTHEDSIGTSVESGAHVLNIQNLGAQGQGLKTAHDGKTVLIPQPSSDPNDPLNWSPVKKHVTLLVISVVAFMPDFESSLGIVTLLPQAVQWEKPQITIQHTLVGNVFCLGVGGLFTVFLSAYFGRLPIAVFFTSMALGTSAWCAAATSYNSFLAARILNGFFSTVAQAGGLMFIQDVFFFHDHPRKINIWAGASLVAPFFGPLIAAFMINKESWPNVFWVATAYSAFCWLLVVSLLDETIYNRSLTPDEQPVPKSRLLRLVGVEQWRTRHLRQTFIEAFMRPFLAISKLPVLLCSIYYFLTFAWIVGANATTSIWLTTIYKFSPYELGFFYFAPLTGILVGVFLGHWLHDFVGTYYTRRHAGVIEPEARLIILWLATPTIAVSTLVIGFALQHVYHYMVLAVFFAAQVAGVMIMTVAVNAYLLDAYPEGSGEVGAWVNFSRSMGGFMATYVELDWVAKVGPVRALGTQAGIAVAAALLVLVLGVYGKRLRRAQGKMVFAMETGY